jgi:hypothetical protein
MALITIVHILKEHEGKPSAEQAQGLIRAIDQVIPQVVPEDGKTLALATMLRGRCLQACGAAKQALLYLQQALAIGPKAGVKRSIERLTRISNVQARPGNNADLIAGFSRRSQCRHIRF